MKCLSIFAEQRRCFSNFGTDAIEAEGLRFVDGACPGNDTLVCAYANDYDTLAALQRILGARGHNCRVANPADIAPAGD